MNLSNYFLRKTKLLIHPYFILSLLVLIINDYIGKPLMPGILTGKLSDFSGLFVFIVFLYVIFPFNAKTISAIKYLCIFVGIFFTLWKLAPVEYIFDSLQSVIHIPMPHRVKDITDLSALIMLPISYFFLINQTKNNKVAQSMNFVRKLAICAIMVITSLAIMATSIVSQYTVRPEFTPNKKLNHNQLLFMLEQTMINNGFEIVERKIDDSGKLIIVASNDSDFTFHASFNIIIANYNTLDNLKIEEVQVSIRNSKPEMHVVEDLIQKKIIQPFNNWIEGLDESN